MAANCQIPLVLAIAVTLAGGLSHGQEPKKAPEKAETDFGDDLRKKVEQLMERAKKGGPDTKLRKLQVERADTALAILPGVFERVRIGKDPFSSLIIVISTISHAHADLEPNHADRVQMAKIVLDFARAVEVEVKQLKEAGLTTSTAVAQARLVRLDAEIALLRLEESAAKEKPSR